MRIRSVKPEFWRSADTASLNYFTRLLFIGLWTYVDDNGVGEDDVNLIRSDLFPRDSNIEELRQRIGRALDELSAWHMIVRYEHATTGRQYFAVANWHHQRISHPTRSSKPLPTSDNVKIISLSGITPEQFGRAPEPLRPDLGNKGSREQGIKVSGEGDGWLDDDEPRCDEHRNIPHPPKCHACKRVREQREAEQQARQPTAYERKKAHNAAVFNALADPPDRPELTP